MKMDMGGSAAVVGVMHALAARKAKVDAVGVVGLAENMPGGHAYRPGDIIRSYAGKTIEVLNTDAEGRLVLCDALAYVQDQYDPRLVIDLATLTGAVMVALGHEYAGVFANQDDVWAKLQAASQATGEKLWRLPLDEAYRDEMTSAVADLKNLGSLGRYGGACSAAGFLEHFIDQGRDWAHLDIAGTAWIHGDKTLTPKYGTGFGVYVLDRMVEDYYEG
jgi:leucyl aminopeptidase